AESLPVRDESGNFEGHRYLTRLTFERTEIEKVRLEYSWQDAEILIARASLYDSANGLSYPLDSVQFPAERWRKLASFGQLDLYENQKAMARAWFVGKVMTMPGEQVLKIIKSGKTPDGQMFDPADAALVESESTAANKNLSSFEREKEDARVSLVKYESRRIELKTHNANDGFLVLSEVFYPGWKALIDGTEAEIHRTDYALRGLAVPRGEHKVEFLYQPASFKWGAGISGLGVMLLLIIAVFGRHRIDSVT
nr:YfhO family protein [Acidobacteriota bacterium]